MIERVVGLAGDRCDEVLVLGGQICVEAVASATRCSFASVVRREMIEGVAVACIHARTLRDLRFRARWREPALRRAVRALVDTARDLQHGLRTTGFHRADTFGYSPSRFLAYMPTPWAVARIALRSTPVSDQDVFVDLGCGKGRMLGLALERGFKRVVGIELIPQLAEAAARNVRRNRSRCEVIVGDASSVALPDDATVVFLFNPASREVLLGMLENIQASVARRPRQMRVLTYGIEPGDIRTQLPWAMRELGPALHIFERVSAQVHLRCICE